MKRSNSGLASEADAGTAMLLRDEVKLEQREGVSKNAAASAGQVSGPLLSPYRKMGNPTTRTRVFRLSCCWSRAMQDKPGLAIADSSPAISLGSHRGAL